MKNEMSIPTIVYVVTAIQDHDSWTAGVYMTEEGARDAVLSRQQKDRQAWNQWKALENEIYGRAEARFRAERGFSSIYAHYLFSPYVDAELEKTPLPPEPERPGHEDVEECWYRAVPVDQWLGKISTDSQDE